MSSQSHEVHHNQHAHPTNGYYIKVGIVLIALTVLEVVGYIGEERHILGPGMATTIILFLSAVKFLLVVALYMHLKFDHKLFTGLFVFPALLATLVIGGMMMLFGPIHGTSTAIHGTMTSNEGIHGAATAPQGQPAAPTTPPSR